MQSKFELSLCKDYVADWNVQDALREFTQNAIDQSTLSEENVYTIQYDKETNKLLISNKESVLETKSLLLGATTKANNLQTIGQFGEGYKIALLVLTRLGKHVTIYNYGKREVWTARFVNSRRYDTEVLTIFVEKDFPWVSVPNNDLTVEISDITLEEYNQFKERTLQLQVLNENNDYLQCSQGRILCKPEHKGKIFVNGLYVSTKEDLTYGYDILSQYLILGRDRNLIDSFDLLKVTSSMWLEHNGERLKKLVLNKSTDVEYLHKEWALTSTVYYTGGYDNTEQKLNEIANDVYEYVAKDNDEENVVFVSTQQEYDDVQETYENVTPCIVSSQIKDLVERVPEYKEKKKALPKRTLTQYQQYTRWKRKYVNKYIDKKALEELDKIVNIKE